MRVLVCSAYFESHRGGIEIVAGRLAREFGSLGHSVSWLAADASSPPSGTGAVGRVVPLRASNASESWLQIPQPIPGLRAFRIIKREVARADVVHVHDALYPAHLLALILARRTVSRSCSHSTSPPFPIAIAAAPHDAGDEPATGTADASLCRSGGVHQQCTAEAFQTSTIGARRA